jgi:hypothetical protein
MTSRRTLQLAPSAIEQRIHVIRGEKVVLDSDLAILYRVQAKRLNEQVKRNRRRFPRDFMFKLTKSETNALRSQIATLKNGRGHHRKYAPYAFTEHGVVMLASVLNSDVAVRASLQIVRAFVRLRAVLSTHVALARKLEQLERNYDGKFAVVFEAIRQLMRPSLSKAKRPIGFQPRVDHEPSDLGGRLQIRTKARGL